MLTEDDFEEISRRRKTVEELKEEFSMWEPEAEIERNDDRINPGFEAQWYDDSGVYRVMNVEIGGTHMFMGMDDITPVDQYWIKTKCKNIVFSDDDEVLTESDVEDTEASEAYAIGFAEKSRTHNYEELQRNATSDFHELYDEITDITPEQITEQGERSE